ncbi:glycosyltransferase family 4 protein [Rarobacter incanus]|uniref:Glycosyltransferase involved in cell wall biosynthesis n=1 Tax=Rarobacter incanus TaxID=153494 RepID=A0A542SLP3_9MICO|nr:glycosyltransferase family 4 protein [Rarobacter incanus]TQK75550.1 glycosyltransferase involved in cell wall biosynthesis [Rarobacter incanus]
MNKRVLFVAAVASGGVVDQVIAAVRAVSEAGSRAAVWAPQSTLDKLAGLPADVDTRVLDIGERPALSDRRARESLRTAFESFDVIHAHGARAGALSALARPRGARPRARLVVTLHNRPVGGRTVRAIGAALIGVCAARCDAVLCVSPDLVRSVRLWGAGRIALATLRGRRDPIFDLAVVCAPSDHTAAPASVHDAERRRDAARYILGMPFSRPTIVTVARLAPQKGLAVAIEAAAHLRAAGCLGETWQWLIVGDGPLLDDLQARATVAGVGEQVQFLGRRMDVPTIIHAADLVVVPSVWEGQSIALMEAIQAAAPIIATKAGGNAYTLGGAGRLVVPGDPAALADMIAALWRSPETRRELRARAIARSRGLAGPADLARQLASVYSGGKN